MKAIGLFLLFIGSLLIIQGYYSNKQICPKETIKVKYIPRTQYEEVMTDDQNLQQFYKGLFEDISVR